MPDATGVLIERVSRPFRKGAPFMATGSLMFAVTAVFLFAQPGSGVVVFAKGLPGTVITIPANAVNPLVVYAVTPPGAPVPNTECEMVTISTASVPFSLGMSATYKGQTLQPVAEVSSGWRVGDTLKCTGTDSQGVVLGHNDGLTHLLQGLGATATSILGGLFALIGFTLRRRLRRP